MNRVLLIAILGCFSLLASCAHKDKDMNSDKAKASQQQTVKKPTVLVDKNKVEGGELAYTCVVSGDERLVTLSKQPKRCEVHYTKKGERNQVAWAEAHPDICQSAYDKIRQNIEAGGFKCKDGLNKDKKPMETASAE